jgi:uncharacterized membrane protein
LGVVAPPLLTIVIFLWVGNTVNEYVVNSLTGVTRDVLAWSIDDTLETLPENAKVKGRTARVQDRVYYRLDNDTYVPEEVYYYVRKRLGSDRVPRNGWEIYQAYVQLRYLPPYVIIPTFVAAFVLLLYLLGRFIAAGIGRLVVNLFERLIHQLPLIRNVYSSVKQVSDFFFAEREVEYTKVVAVEYPRKGIWSLGLVTGESMLDIRSAANEPVLSLLIPTSPMPMTGYTITVLKSETIDLNISIDQAFQFIVSCGVVVPPSQIVGLTHEEREEILATERGDEVHRFLPGPGYLKQAAKEGEGPDRRVGDESQGTDKTVNEEEEKETR